MTKEVTLFIDGENFLFSIAKVLKDAKIIKHKSDINKYSLNTLIATALKDFPVTSTRFYAGKINVPKQIPELATKSHALAESQRRLKRSLENQGVTFVLSGHVRLQDTKVDARGKVHGIFKEKGTDVRIAVDMVSFACDDNLDTALILSSDSDMQPAVKELTKRGVRVIYVGFENSINAGLSQTTNRTVLIRQNEIIAAWHAANPQIALQ